MAIRHQILKDRRFHDLMPYRVREILLVSSPYDAFILEEDGQLTEQVFFEYRDVSLSGPPRVTHAATGEDALRLLKTRRFDLILTMTSLADMGVNAFGRRVKKLRPGPLGQVKLADLIDELTAGLQGRHPDTQIQTDIGTLAKSYGEPVDRRCIH